MQHVYMDENWVVEQYLKMEKEKSWNNLDSENDMLVLNLEREALAETLGAGVHTLPAISDDQNDQLTT